MNIIKIQHMKFSIKICNILKIKVSEPQKTKNTDMGAAISGGGGAMLLQRLPPKHHCLSKMQLYSPPSEGNQEAVLQGV